MPIDGDRETLRYGGHLLAYLNISDVSVTHDELLWRSSPVMAMNSVDARPSLNGKVKGIPEIDILCLVLEMLQGSSNDLFLLTDGPPNDAGQVQVPYDYHDFNCQYAVRHRHVCWHFT